MFQEVLHFVAGPLASLSNTVCLWWRGTAWLKQVLLAVSNPRCEQTGAVGHPLQGIEVAIADGERAIR